VLLFERVSKLVQLIQVEKNVESVHHCCVVLTKPEMWWCFTNHNMQTDWGTGMVKLLITFLLLSIVNPSKIIWQVPLWNLSGTNMICS